MYLEKQPDSYPVSVSIPQQPFPEQIRMDLDSGTLTSNPLQQETSKNPLPEDPLQTPSEEMALEEDPDLMIEDPEGTPLLIISQQMDAISRLNSQNLSLSNQLSICRSRFSLAEKNLQKTETEAKSLADDLAREKTRHASALELERFKTETKIKRKYAPVVSRQRQVICTLIIAEATTLLLLISTVIFFCSG